MRTRPFILLLPLALMSCGAPEPTGEPAPPADTLGMVPALVDTIVDLAAFDLP